MINDLQDYTSAIRTTGILSLALFLSGCARPLAEFTWEEMEYTSPAQVAFMNSTKGASEFVWTFGDGHSSTEMNPVHVFQHSGEYDVSLKVVKGNWKHTTQKKIIIEESKPCLVEIQTSLGKIVVQLFDETPLHRDNFIRLVETGFYDSLLFHRVIRGFMIQGGDPNSKGAAFDNKLGSGGPGYQIDAEFRPDKIHIKGALCAARMSDGVNPLKKSSGSQFYIVQGNKASDSILDGIEARKGFRYTTAQREAYKYIGGTPQLDQDYTVFGIVVEGLDVVDAIASVKTGAGDRPEENVWMKMRLVH